MSQQQDQNEIRATREELDAMARLMRDHDGKILFSFIERRMRGLDASTRRMFGDGLMHANGRRYELSSLLDLAGQAVSGDIMAHPNSEAPEPPKPLEPSWGGRY